MKTFLIILGIVLSSCSGTEKVSTTTVDDDTKTFVSSKSEQKLDSVKTKELIVENLFDSSSVYTITEIHYEPVLLDSGQQVVSVPISKKETKTEDKNITKEKQSAVEKDDYTKNNKDSVEYEEEKDVEIDSKSEETPKDPYKTRYIFYILLLIVLTVLFLWIKSKFKIF